MTNKKQLQSIAKTKSLADEKTVRMFNALSDANRFNLIKILSRYHNLCVSDLSTIFGITPSAVSQHLRILELTGLVRRVRKGQRTCYQLRREDALVRTLTKVIGSD